MTPREREYISLCDAIAEHHGVEAVTYTRVRDARGGRGSYSTIGAAIHKWKVLRGISLRADFVASSKANSFESMQIERLELRCTELESENNYLKQSLSSIEQTCETILQREEKILDELTRRVDKTNEDGK